MSHLFLQTLRWQRARLLVVALVAFGWGLLISFFYSEFSDMVRQLASQNALFERLTNFGSGNLVTVGGTITLGFQHPLAIAFVAIFAVGATSVAIAGERQQGTLEVLLARPLPRNGVLLTIGAGLLLATAIVLAALLGGMAIGAVTHGFGDQLAMEQLPLVFLNGLLLWAAFAAFGLAASVSFDRSGPAIGVALAYLLVNYFLEIIGSLWADAAWMQEYSLFHHFQPAEILAREPALEDGLILLAAIVVPMAYALLRFPRRDLAAPS